MSNTKTVNGKATEAPQVLPVATEAPQANVPAPSFPLPSWEAEKGVAKLLQAANTAVAAQASGDGQKAEAAKKRFAITLAAQGQGALRDAEERLAQAEAFLASKGTSLLRF